jgi:uncharacterized membrane protein
MAAAEIVFWWLAFAATHMGLSSAPVRSRLVGKLGDRGFLGVYTLIAFATFVPLVSTYFAHKHEGAFSGIRLVSALRRLIRGHGARPLAAGGGVAAPEPGGASCLKTEVAGAYHITRHPLFMAVGLYGLLHLLVARERDRAGLLRGLSALRVWAGCRHQTGASSRAGTRSSAASTRRPSSSRSRDRRRCAACARSGCRS